MSIELAIYTWPLSGKGIFLRNVLKLSDPRKTELKIPKGDGGYALPLSSPPVFTATMFTAFTVVSVY